MPFLVLAAAVFYGFSLAAAADIPDPSSEDRPRLLDAGQLAERIDAELSARWVSEGIEPAPLADDAEYLRRLHLDLVGKIPPVSRVRSYLADSSADKRLRLNDELLESAAHATHLSNMWRDMLLAGSNNDPQFRATVPAFQSWLRLRFVARIPYDQIVSELLTAPVTLAPRPAATGRGTINAPSPQAFYLAHERKPESLADGTSRVFLGLQVGCAQCHDHPFASWKQEEFWALAAFFGRLEEESPLSSASDAARGILIPDTETTVAARFLDGALPDWNSTTGRRSALASWITDPENPYFARATVNRLWAHFFGRGFVEPVDDMEPANAASHPRLLAEISRQFVLHGYDLEYVIRAITATRAYQLSSRTTAGVDGQRQAEHFARMPLRRLTAEQLFDSLVQATGFREPAVGDPNLLGDATARSEFVRMFTEPGQQDSEPRTSIIQALALMNGQFVADATALERSELLSAVVDSPFMDDAQRVETLFLATLSRHPTDTESATLRSYITAAASPRARREALGDVFWALLNTAEFGMNH